MADDEPPRGRPDPNASGADSLRPQAARTAQAHPTPELLQQVADGAPTARGTSDPPHHQADVTAHLAACDACRGEVEEARRVGAALSLLADPPHDFLERVRARRASGERVILPAAELARVTHPSAEALDRYADYACDPDTERTLFAHVSACTTCQDAVEALRHTTAALSVSTAPPEDLRARVRARRAAGDRVILPVVPAAPDAERSGTPPPGRAPVDVVRGRRAAPFSPRWSVASAGAVAALLFVAVRYESRARPDAERAGAPPAGAPVAREPARRPGSALPPPAVTTVAPPTAPHAVPDVASPARPRTPDRLRGGPDQAGGGASDAPEDAATSGAPAPGAPASGAPASAGVPAVVLLRDEPDGVSVALAGAPPEGFAPAQTQALDTVVHALLRDPARRAAVRYTDPAFTHASRSYDVARRASDYLVLRGVAQDRVALVRVVAVRLAAVPAGGRPTPTDAIVVVVSGTRPAP